jgi:2-polyprenyl-3-methyl-5-hydroxy-6-metoxy-1,4-benzoquinol methylase
MNFDEHALTWDNDPKKVERAKAVAGEIIRFLQPDQQLTALEFGCGTGSLSFELKDFFKTIILADSSRGMISVLKDKIRASGVRNFKPLLINFPEEDIKIPKQDVIYTLMTLHHMPDIGNTIQLFHSLLKQDGYLCISDLVKEDGSFHGPDEDVHHGFDRTDLTGIIQDNNFTVDYYNECYVIEKETGDEVRQYPLFIMICRKMK